MKCAAPPAPLRQTTNPSLILKLRPRSSQRLRPPQRQVASESTPGPDGCALADSLILEGKVKLLERAQLGAPFILPGQVDKILAHFGDLSKWHEMKPGKGLLFDTPKGAELRQGPVV